jgi:molybdate-binding protein
MGFVSLGTQSVRALAAPDRVEKPGVVALEALLTEDDSATDLAGVTLSD